MLLPGESQARADSGSYTILNAYVYPLRSLRLTLAAIQINKAHARQVGRLTFLRVIMVIRNPFVSAAIEHMTGRSPLPRSTTESGPHNVYGVSGGRR